VSRIILLDAGPLGMVTHPRANTEIKDWLRTLLQAGAIVRVPEIADYEVRRELLRVNSSTGVRRLEALKSALGYVPLTTEVMLLAAEFWADSRRRGRPTAPDLALDGDVILAAQAVRVSQNGDDAIIATTNVGHLSRFVAARRWQEIS
jgi:predicted nucleic acid-binding protein